MAALAAEDGVCTTVRHPNRTIRTTDGRIRCRQRRMWSWWCVCVAPQGDQPVSCHPWGVHVRVHVRVGVCVHVRVGVSVGVRGRGQG